eukprot:8158671-Pyramimonas_sp.AAC.1
MAALLLFSLDVLLGRLRGDVCVQLLVWIPHPRLFAQLHQRDGLAQRLRQARQAPHHASCPRPPNVQVDSPGRLSSTVTFEPSLSWMASATTMFLLLLLLRFPQRKGTRVDVDLEAMRAAWLPSS